MGFSWISGLDALLGGGRELNPLLEVEVILLLRSKCHNTGILELGLGFPSALCCSQGNHELAFPGAGIALLPDVAGTPQY